MKTITSPVKKFPGTIEMPESLTLPQLIEYSEAQNSVLGKSSYAHIQAILPVQIKLTGEWHIDGLPKDTDWNTRSFTPVLPILKFMNWLQNEFNLLILGEESIPNASEPKSLPTPAETSANQE